MLRRSLLTILCILHFSAFTFSQNTHGIPYIQNFSPSDYKLHPNNFAITQNADGIMYFGNAYGILQYDGIFWKHIRLPHGKSGISLYTSNKNEIIVGSVGDVGKLIVDNTNTYYQSFNQYISPNDSAYEEVWHTWVRNDSTYFISLKNILIKNKSSFSHLPVSNPDEVFEFAQKTSHHIYIRESEKGLMTIEGNQLKLIKGAEKFNDAQVYAALDYNDTSDLILSTKGAYLYSPAGSKALNWSLKPAFLQYPLTCSVKLNKNTWALGSYKEGIILFNKQGNVTQVLNKDNGLPSNYITNLYVDKEDNLWVTTDRGISYIHVSSPYTLIDENMGIEGMGYAAVEDDSIIYLGTSQGVFYADLSSKQNDVATPQFTPLAGTNEQVWTLRKIENTLFCGDSRGLHIIKDKKAYIISPNDYSGAWTIRRTLKEGQVLVGTYNGLEIYERENSEWKFVKKIKGFNESARIVELDSKGNIWVCHGNKGLFKLPSDFNITAHAEATNYSIKTGLPPAFFKYITKIDSTVLFIADTTVYHYNAQQDQLIRYDSNSTKGSKELAKKIYALKNNNIHLYNREAIEIMTKANGSDYQTNRILFRKISDQLIGSFEFLWKMNDCNYFIGSMSGFIHFNPDVAKKNNSFKTSIRKVNITGITDSTIYNGGVKPVKYEIPYSLNSLKFFYAAQFYEDQTKNLYQYWLEDNHHTTPQWSDWNTDLNKEFTNLRENNYTLHVRCQNLYAKVSEESTFSFTILPPWYRSNLAYALYFAFALIFICLTVLWVKRKIKTEKEKIRNEKEREIIEIKNKQLESELIYKNNEIANMATNLTQKNEFLSKLKKELTQISDNGNSDDTTTQIPELIKSIEKGLKFDDSWDHFQTSFDALYHDLLYKLRKAYPFLKPADLLLCAYIRMNKSNKEIAELLNVSEHAIKKRRFRLRKKLEIHEDLKLSEWLIEQSK